MHILLGLALIGALVAFAFGERAAQAVVGITLATLAVLAVAFVGTMIYVVHRDNAAYHQASCVKIGSAIAVAGDCR